MNRQIAEADVAKLLEAVFRVESCTRDIAQRRQQLLADMMELVQADLGHWSWGRGHPATSEVTPVAQIVHGFTSEQIAVVAQAGLDRETDRTFRDPILERLQGKPQISSVRRDVFPDDKWRTSKFYRQFISKLDMDSWIHCVRYISADTWCSVFLLRRAGKEEFDEREAVILDVALAGIHWLWPQVEEAVPPERFVGLTPRQRTVLLMQLDGLSRKQIAAHLDVTEQTVGDHLKALYKHFGVHSASELAARFLRSA
jgi:DNA-binding CsgD family transcriptional regulator